MKRKKKHKILPTKFVVRTEDDEQRKVFESVNQSCEREKERRRQWQC